MDRFGNGKPFRFDDPGDSGEPFTIFDGGKGGAVIDLTNSLLLDDLTAASMSRSSTDDGIEGEVYALGLTGLKFGTEDRRTLLVVLTSESAAVLCAELARLTSAVGDTEFITIFTERLARSIGMGP